MMNLIKQKHKKNVTRMSQEKKKEKGTNYTFYKFQYLIENIYRLNFLSICHFSVPFLILIFDFLI